MDPSALGPDGINLVFDSSGLHLAVSPLDFNVKLTTEVKVEPAVYFYSYLVIFYLFLFCLLDLLIKLVIFLLLGLGIDRILPNLRGNDLFLPFSCDFYMRQPHTYIFSL